MSGEPHILLKEIVSEFQILRVPHYLYCSFWQLVGIVTPARIWQNIFKKVRLSRKISWKKLLQISNSIPQQFEKQDINDKMITLAIISLAILVWLKLDLNEQLKQIPEGKIEIFIQPHKGMKDMNSSLLFSVQSRQKLDKLQISKQIGSLILKELNKRNIKLEINSSRFYLIPAHKLKYQSIVLPSIIQISLSEGYHRCQIMMNRDRTVGNFAAITLPEQINLMDYCYYFYKWQQFQKYPFLLKVLNKLQTKIVEVNKKMNYYFVLNPQSILIVDSKYKQEFNVQISMPKIQMQSFFKQRLPISFQNCIYAKQNINKYYQDCDLWSLAFIILHQCAYHCTYNIFSEQLQKNFRNNVKLFIIKELKKLENEGERFSCDLINKIKQLLRFDKLVFKDKHSIKDIPGITNKINVKRQQQEQIKKNSLKTNTSMVNQQKYTPTLPFENKKFTKSNKILQLNAFDNKEIQESINIQTSYLSNNFQNSASNKSNSQNEPQSNHFKFWTKNILNEQNMDPSQFQPALQIIQALNTKLLFYLNGQTSHQTENDKNNQEIRYKYFYSRVLTQYQIELKGNQIYQDEDCWNQIGFYSQKTTQKEDLCQLCKKYKTIFQNICGHGACYNCYYSNISKRIVDKSFSDLSSKIEQIICHHDDCFCPLTREIIQTILKDNNTEKKIFQRKLCVQTAKLNLKSLSLCKNDQCNSSYIYETSSDSKIFYCIKCKQMSCIRCFQISHGDLNCHNLKKARLSFQQSWTQHQQRLNQLKQKLINQANYQQLLQNIRLSRKILSELENILKQCLFLIFCQKQRRYSNQKIKKIKYQSSSNFQFLIISSYKFLINLYRSVQTKQLHSLFEEPFYSKLFATQKLLNQLHTAHLGLIYSAYNIDFST